MSALVECGAKADGVLTNCNLWTKPSTVEVERAVRKALDLYRLSPQDAAAFGDGVMIRFFVPLRPNPCLPPCTVIPPAPAR